MLNVATTIVAAGKIAPIFAAKERRGGASAATGEEWEGGKATPPRTFALGVTATMVRKRKRDGARGPDAG